MVEAIPITLEQPATQEVGPEWINTIKKEEMQSALVALAQDPKQFGEGSYGEEWGGFYQKYWREAVILTLSFGQQSPAAQEAIDLRKREHLKALDVAIWFTKRVGRDY